jgi:hypothetical protein
MSGSTFQESISGDNVVAAPQALNGGTNNFYFDHIPRQPPQHEPFSTVPFVPDHEFIDRPDISVSLRDKCDQPGSRTALVGLGGVG